MYTVHQCIYQWVLRCFSYNFICKIRHQKTHTSNGRMYAIKIAKANDPNIPSCPAPLLSTFQVAMGEATHPRRWISNAIYDILRPNLKKITRRRSKWHGKSLRVSEIVCFVQICCEQIYSSPLSLSLDHLRRCNLEPVPQWKLWWHFTHLDRIIWASSLVTQLYPNIEYWHDHHDPHLEWLIPWSMMLRGALNIWFSALDFIFGGSQSSGDWLLFWSLSSIVCVGGWSRCGLDVPRCYFLEDLDDAGQNEMLQPHLLSEPPGP